MRRAGARGFSIRKGNALVAHGGGPTAVINASLAGLVAGCRRCGQVDSLFGARQGWDGLLRGDLLDLLRVDAAHMERVGRTPGSALGSSRRKLEAADYEQVVAVFRQNHVRWFFYTGGNGSMATALQIEKYAASAGYDLQVIGIPKTLDNDLGVTHHTPGYASTARFFACAARDVGEDNRSLPTPICVLETLGRNAGWVAAATSLARQDENDAPHLIYLPERRVSLEAIAADVERVYRRIGRVVIAVCEGQRDEKGQTFGADVDRPDYAGHALATNLGYSLARLLTEKTGLRARAEKPGLLGRSCGLFTVDRDLDEAYRCGERAADAACAGESSQMVALREDGTTFLTCLENVATVERLMPREWIASNGSDVTEEFRQYAEPLAGPIPTWAHLPLPQP